MKKLVMEFGEILNTRSSGEKLRQLIKLEIQKNGKVSLDFDEIQSISQSFADESFGKFVEEFSFDEFKSKIKIKNASDNNISVIKYVIAERVKRGKKAV